MLLIKSLFTKLICIGTLLIGYQFFVEPLESFGQGSDYCEIAERAFKIASRLRGLSMESKVPCLVRDKAQVKEYLLSTIATKLPPRKMELEGYVFGLIGMIPEGFDYEKKLVDLYVNQIGGYYDPEKNHFIMAAWMPAILQMSIAVHELTHGLQDQHFNLEKFMDPKIENSDLLSARSALVEGDANYIMLDYSRELVGQTPLKSENNVDSFMMQNIVGLKLMASSLGVPESLQMSLIFPYTSGLRFAHSLMKSGDLKALDQAYAHPPRSTKEILHPQEYLKGTAKLVEISVTDLETEMLPVPKDRQLVYQDTIGEFGISALLGMYVKDRTESTRAANGWMGDRVALFENNGGVGKYLRWKTSWESVRDAEEFYNTYRTSLKSRFPGNSFLAEASTVGNKKVYLKRDGQSVMVGMDIGAGELLKP